MNKYDSPTIIKLDICDSTNEYIKKHYMKIQDKFPLIITSPEQLKGRGRNNRKWFSPCGTGLYISMGFLMDNRQKIKLLSLIAGLSIAEALETISQKEFKLKWPNDVLYGKRKIAGVLIENIINVNEIISICGIGINLNQSQKDFPPGLRQKATSLKMITGQAIDIDTVTITLINTFFKWLAILEEGDKTKIIKMVNDLSVFSKGDPISFHHNNKIITGFFNEINREGGLILEKKNGNRDIFYSGEINLEI